jgi:mRNA interferase MazF
MIRIETTAENNLSKLSTADTFQIRSVSQQRLIKKVGIVAEEIMQEISNALAIVLNIK